MDTMSEITNNCNNHPPGSINNDYDMQLAELIVKRLIPLDIHMSDLNITVRYKSAAHIGGDLAYVYPIDSTHTYMTICDVVGHGVASCLMVAFIHTQILMILQNKPETLFEFIHQLNDVCYNVFQGLTLYFTYGVVQYDHSDSSFQIATCGHPPIMILKSDGSLTFHSTPYPPLGMFGSLPVEVINNKHHLEPGDKLILYTDGILEAQNPSSNDFFGEKRFTDLLVQNRHLSDSDLAEQVIQEVKDFARQEHQDDLTLMIISH